MNFQKGLVSICIPSYNGAEYIADTIRSVLDQSYQNIEIIVNDDISSDNTAEIVSSFNDDRIKFYKNTQRKGLAGNWNAAVRYASGEYVKLLCQDDLLFKDALKKQVEILEKNKDASCSIGNTYVIDSSGDTVMKRERFKEDKVYDGRAYARRSLLGRNIYCEPANLLYRTERFYSCGEYDETLKYTPDWDFAIRISSDSRICCIKDLVMKFRISDSSETSRLYKEQSRALISDADRFIVKQKITVGIGMPGILVFKLNTRILSFLRGVILAVNKKKKK